MEAPFKRIGLAITFSPTGKALLSEASRLQNLFDAELILIHIGEKNPETEKKLEDLINSAGVKRNSTSIIWQQGDPAKTILKASAKEDLDLLIAGALEKESFINYYVGSVARKIMREAPCSVLIFTHPQENREKLNNFYVTADFTSDGENTINTAYKFAVLEKAEKLVIIREFQVPGLAVTIQDSGSIKEAENALAGWKLEEEAKLRLLVRELNLKDIEIETVILYGRKGWEANNYVRNLNGDILVITGPKRKLKLMDRVFQNDIEFIFEKLANSILIIKS